MKLASIETIHSITTHPNSEILVKAKVLGWNVVIKKDDFQEGESVVFIFPDVIVDKTNPEFSFMESRKWKVWQARFRGEPSAGLVMPLSVLKSYINADDLIDNYKNQIGLDVGILIKCEKYEKSIDINTNGNAAGSFPSNLVRKTDEDNLRSNPRVIEEFKGKTVIVTQKADGCLDGSTQIETSLGSLSIQDLCEKKINCKILSYNIDSQKIEYEDVMNYFINENINNWYEIELENGIKLKITENHYLWLPELLCYRKVSDLSEKDVVLLKN